MITENMFFQKSFPIFHSIVLLAVLCFANCKKESSPAGSLTDKERVARYGVSVLKVASEATPTKDDILGYLQQGEVVTLEKTLTVGKTNFSEISLAGTKEKGFVKSDSLALYAILFTSEGVTLYSRPNLSSRIQDSSSNIALGTVGMVLNEDNEWIEVSGGGSGTYFTGWMKKDSATYVKELESINFAIQIQRIKTSYANLDEKKKEKAIVELQELTSKSYPVNEFANKVLNELVGPSDPPPPADPSAPAGQ